VIRDRGALAREVSDESGRALVENVYRLQVMNTSEQRRVFSIRADGVSDLELASEASFEVAPASTVSVPLRLRAPATLDSGSHRVFLELQAQDDASVRVREKTTFLGLRR
jgi:polyferredoxin